MFRIIVAGVLVTALCGCISTPDRFGVRHAIVDDVTATRPFLSGYCVVAVDGKPVQRAKSSTDTVIPMALVEAGEHTLTLNVGSGDVLAEGTVTATFDAGRRYRIKSEDGKLSVVQETE